MSKKKRNNPDGSQAQTVSSRKKMVKPFVDQMVDKADVIFAKSNEILVRLEKRGAPSEVLAKVRGFVPRVEEYREVLFGLRDSGWQPSAKAEPAKIEPGDRVAIKEEHRDAYSYIRGVSEGTVALRAISVDDVGRSQEIVVESYDPEDSSAPSVPCGRIPRSRLVRA